MKIWKPTAAALAALFLAGCVGGTSRVEYTPAYERQVSSDGFPVTANFTARNRGVYLFGCVPIWSGKPTSPNMRHYRMFHDYVSEGYNVAMIEEKLKDVQANDIRDVKSQISSAGWFSLWLVWTRTAQTRAVSVRLPKEMMEK